MAARSIISSTTPRSPALRAGSRRDSSMSGGCEVGITRDDGCLVVLVQQFPGHWIPTSHVPREAATVLAEMAYEPYPLQAGL